MKFDPQSLRSIAIFIYGFINIAFQNVAHAMPPGMEAERISHYSPDTIPVGVRKDLPPITDTNGMRDIFFYPDGLLKGRVIHLRVPKNYVSTDRSLPARHSDKLSFAVIYPSMKSILDPSVSEAITKHGGLILDEQIEISIERPDPSQLAVEVANLFGRISTAKQLDPKMKFEDLPTPPGFILRDHEGNHTQGIRQTETELLRENYTGEAIQDSYIEWDYRDVPVKYMTCRMFDRRPSCNISIMRITNDSPYRLSLYFDAKLLPNLPEIISRSTALINSFFAETIN